MVRLVTVLPLATYSVVPATAAEVPGYVATEEPSGRRITCTVLASDHAAHFESASFNCAVPVIAYSCASDSRRSSSVEPRCTSRPFAVIAIAETSLVKRSTLATFARPSRTVTRDPSDATATRPPRAARSMTRAGAVHWKLVPFERSTMTVEPIAYGNRPPPAVPTTIGSGSFAWMSRVAVPSAFGVVLVVVAVHSRSVATELPVPVTHSARPFVTASAVIPSVFDLQRCFFPSCTGLRADVCHTNTLSQSVALGVVANATSVPSAARAVTALRAGIDALDMAPAAPAARQAATIAKENKPRLTTTSVERVRWD